MGDHVPAGTTMFGPKEVPFDHRIITAKGCAYAKNQGGTHETHLLIEEAFHKGAEAQYELERTREKKQNASI